MDEEEMKRERRDFLNEVDGIPKSEDHSKKEACDDDVAARHSKKEACDDDAAAKHPKKEACDDDAAEKSKSIIKSRVNRKYEKICVHPGSYGGMCIMCGQNIDDSSAVPLTYINKNLRLGSEEIARLRDKDFKDLLHHQRKLYLLLDLDHTLLNSTKEIDLEDEEREALSDASQSNLFRADKTGFLTKLRPFVHTFLEKASELFEMYIYTMGSRLYASEMAAFLDPGNIYFDSRIISRDDTTQKHQKGLDIVLGRESGILILDDSKEVWKKHKRNLILMDRYHFFASSCKNFEINHKSHLQLRTDESETEGALATVLKILQQIHTSFFDMGGKDNLEDRDVRKVLETARKEVLQDCKIVFSCDLTTKWKAWKMAEKLGATCSDEVDSSVTHVVSLFAGTNVSRWAETEKKFLISPRWIEASNYLWRKQPEENFPVT